MESADETSKRAGTKYRGLLEAAADAMVVVNPRGQIVLLNLQAEKQFGYRRDELVGQPVKNIIPEGFGERLLADSSRTPAEALAQQMGTGIELSGRRKDGSQFPIEIMLSPLEGLMGTLMAAAIRDISVRKAAEKHLEQMDGAAGVKAVRMGGDAAHGVHRHRPTLDRLVAAAGPVGPRHRQFDRLFERDMR